MNNKERKKVSFITLGCKVNQYETNAMEQQFIEHGYTITDSANTANIYVINTCLVTNIAERKSRQMIRRAKQQNKDAVIVVCGCYAEISKKELEKINEIDLILNDKDKKKIVEKVEEFINSKEMNENQHEEGYASREYVEYGSVTYTEKNRAVIKIQDGCNMFCSYCIIPYARGRIRSRKIENILEEIKEIASKGIKEVVLTGIHIASYGKDWEDSNIGLIDLLEKINQIEGIKRIRLGSLEPTIITKDFLDRLIKLEKICHHFHLSLQSGCDETLKRMNRKYTTKQFEEICKMIRKYYSDVSLTTDIIVGFPGETEYEFEQTFNFLSKIKFYKMHVFKFSQRKGTVADKMPNQVDGSIKEKRSQRLIKLSEDNQNYYNKEYIGKSIEILFEEIENGYLKGHSSNYIEAKVQINDIEKPEKFINELKTIKVEKVDKNSLEIIGSINL